LAKTGHAIFWSFSREIMHIEIHDTQYAHKKLKKISLPNLANIIILLSFRYHLENALLHARKNGIEYHVVMRLCKNLLLKFAKYYHFVIIVINNIQQENASSWYLFLSFFRSQKITFFDATKHETIMLSFFTMILVK